jgi:hypothetical protein
MIDYARVCQLKPLHVHQGLTASQSAKAVSLDRRTVASWLAQEHCRPRQPRPAPSKLDLFKPDIVRMLARSPSSTAPICQHLREHGFDGS